MPLPLFERTVFRKNPLYSVSAQIRFPPILRIQVEPPAAFQDLIRTEFPGYSVMNPSPTGLPADFPAEIQAAMRTMVQASMNVNTEKTHRFSSADGNWAFLLSQQSLTMSCSVYPKWEIFRQKLRSVIDPFISIYQPAFAMMVGLRYQNAIERSKLGLNGVPWSDLLQPFIAAEFGCSGLSENEIISDQHRFEFRDGQDRIFVQHGLGSNQLTKETVYSIDGNFNSLDKVELTDVFSRLDQLNKHSGSLFRICITDRLFSSLEPIAA